MIMGLGVLCRFISCEPVIFDLKWLIFDPFCLSRRYGCLTSRPVCCCSQNLINTTWQFTLGRMMTSRFDRGAETMVRRNIREKERVWMTTGDGSKWIIRNWFVSYCTIVIWSAVTALLSLCIDVDEPQVNSDTEILISISFIHCIFERWDSHVELTIQMYYRLHLIHSMYDWRTVRHSSSPKVESWAGEWHTGSLEQPKDELHQVVAFNLTVLMFVLGLLLTADVTPTTPLSKMFCSLSRHWAELYKLLKF